MVALATDTVTEQTDDGREDLRRALADVPHEEEWIEAESLEVDHTYQRRRIRHDWVKDIADGFDPELFKPLLVNRRRWDGGRLFVMDGQHRLLALRRMGWGDTLVPCLVYDNLPYETEAKQFDTQGYNRPLTPQERFRSALARHEPDEELIDGLVRRSGYQLNLSTGDTTEGQIPGVETLRAILRQHGSGLLTDVLEACRDGFGTEHGPKAGVLTGLARFMARFRKHERYDRRRMVVALKGTTVNGLATEGGDVKRTMGVSVADAIAFKVHQAYNYRLLGDRRLPEYTFGRMAKAA